LENKVLEVYGMKNTWKKFGVAVATVSLGISTILTGCGSSSNAESQEKDDGVTTITVGSGTTYSPYCYLDENGNAVGYEYDVLKAVDEKLPQYEFKYESMDFDNLLLSLDAGKVDVVAHQYEVTDERKEKYLFANEAYTTYNTYITVLSTVNDINNLDDLQGKKVWAGGTTSASNTILINYNSQHADNPLELVNNTDTSGEYQITSLQQGAWAATIAQERDVASWNEEYGNGSDIVKTVGEPINSSLTYYLYKKDNTQLRDDIDGALKELKEDGTLAKISEQWLGGDYTGE
jgi:L-cystine transport system substrate-binding protein